MDREQNHHVNVWRVLALLLMVVVAAMAGVFFVMHGSLSGTPAQQEETTEPADSATDHPEQTTAEEEPAPVQEAETADTAATQNTAGTQEQEPPSYDIRITFADGFHHTGIEGTTAYLMAGRDNPTGEIIRTLKTDEKGNCKTSLPAGDYTLVFGDEAYYDGMENLSIGSLDGPGNDYISDSDESYEFWKFLLPRQGEGTICLVLEWKGNDDLDLCVFNATAKRYISALQPDDGAGCYLVEDDGDGSPGWEVIVIRDYTKSQVYTPYIRDGNSLMRGSLSAMEANGVRLSVLDHNGLLFSQEADPGEHAALWMPCYILDGKVIKDSVYEYDPAKYAWAAYSKY